MNYLRRAGTTEDRIVIDADTGERAGKMIEHWDDHVDAHVLARRATVYVPDTGLHFPGKGLLLPGDIAAVDKRGAPVKVIAGGAWSVSGMYLLTWIDLLDASQLAIDLSLTTHRWALYNNSETPNFSAEGSGYVTTNEVTGAGYTAGGQVILSPTTTESPTGTLMYDMADEVWASPTTVTAFGAKLYADALAGNNFIVAMNFAGSFASTAGTFTMQFASTGVITLDLTP